MLYCTILGLPHRLPLLPVRRVPRLRAGDREVEAIICDVIVVHHFSHQVIVFE